MYLSAEDVIQVLFVVMPNTCLNCDSYYNICLNSISNIITIRVFKTSVSNAINYLSDVEKKQRGKKCMYFFVQIC